MIHRYEFHVGLVADLEYHVVFTREQVPEVAGCDLGDLVPDSLDQALLEFVPLSHVSPPGYVLDRKPSPKRRYGTPAQGTGATSCRVAVLSLRVGSGSGCGRSPLRDVGHGQEDDLPELLERPHV